MSPEDERLDIGDASAEHPVAIPSELPILPLRDTVLFPNSFLPLAVARESSVRLIEEAISGSKLVGVFTQRDASIEEPTQDDLHRVGTATHIHKMFKLPDGSLRLIVQGLSRLKLDNVIAVRTSAPRSARPKIWFATSIASRSTRCSGTSRPTSSTSCRCRRCCRTTCRR